MQNTHALMHEDIECGSLRIDRDSGALIAAGDFDRAYAPFLGNADERRIKKWWGVRAVAGSRKDMAEIFRRAGCFTSAEYAVKNLALSMTDTYWIRPEGDHLSWDQVRFRPEAGVLIPYHNATSYDPNATLGGQMSKYWDLTRETPQLVKIAQARMGQQAVNEAFATLLHERQHTAVPFVKYTAKIIEEGEIRSRCDAFTGRGREFLSAMEVLDSEKIRQEQSLYDAFIEICEKHGANREDMQQFMDYQTLTDFVLSNTDEHLMNFGALRDTDTMRITGPAPIFDSGNSMFYSDPKGLVYTRAQLLERKITAIHETEERMLSHVKHRDIVQTDLLPAKEEVFMFYRAYQIPEDHAAAIARNYEIKVEMLKEFQQGHRVSLYLERQKGRDS